MNCTDGISGKRTHLRRCGRLDAIIVDEDLERAADLLRLSLAPVHRRHGRGRQLPPRGLRPYGLRGEAATIQDHYLAGDKKAASTAVPTAMAGDVTLIGSWAGIAGEIQWWQRPSPPRSASTAACVTGVKSPASCGADAGAVQCCGALTRQEW